MIRLLLLRLRRHGGRDSGSHFNLEMLNSVELAL